MATWFQEQLDEAERRAVDVELSAMSPGGWAALLLFLLSTCWLIANTY